MSKLIKQTTNLVNAKSLNNYKKLVNEILEQKPLVLKGNLLSLVKHLFNKKGKIMELVEKHQTPFYIIDRLELNKSIEDYLRAFKRVLPRAEHFYAMKLNPHPYIIEKILKRGMGIDASSGRELEIALRHGAKKILFSGPGKTNRELELAIKHNRKIIIQMDSFGELDRLGQITKRREKSIRAGIRVFTKYHGVWAKFGIPLEDLKKFWLLSKKHRLVNLQGIQFHMSFIKDENLYQKIIQEVAHYLKNNFSRSMLRD